MEAILPHLDVLIVQIITFILGSFAIWKMYLGPLRKHLAERREGIAKDLANADAARAEAEALRAQLVKERLAMADELKQAKDAAKADVAKLREELLAKAKHDQEALLKSGRTQIQAETLDAIAKVRDYAAVLVVEATAKMLDKKLDAKADQALAQKLLDSVKVKASKN
jgi:F-type H+-transporting ATPase subunit b